MKKNSRKKHNIKHKRKKTSKKLKIFMKYGGDPNKNPELLINRTNYFFLDNNNIKKIKHFETIKEKSEVTIISNKGDSASGGVVTLYHDKTENKKYIVKTNNECNRGNYFCTNFNTENIILLKLNTLLKNKHTPHLFYNYLYNIKTNSNGEISEYSIVNETSIYKVVSLYDLITKYLIKYDYNMCLYVLKNIIFQILFTLECFNRFIVKHNDLHAGNVLIVLCNDNILFNHTYNKSNYFTYVFNDREKNKKTFKLRDIGIYARIIDFDRSILNIAINNLTYSNYFYKGFFYEYMNNYNRYVTYINIYYNEYVDFLKIMLSIIDALKAYNFNNTFIDEIINFIFNKKQKETIFPHFSLLLPPILPPIHHLEQLNFNKLTLHIPDYSIHDELLKHIDFFNYLKYNSYNEIRKILKSINTILKDMNDKDIYLFASGDNGTNLDTYIIN